MIRCLQQLMTQIIPQVNGDVSRSVTLPVNGCCLSPIRIEELH
jgi:hypothetical protein